MFKIESVTMAKDGAIEFSREGDNGHFFYDISSYLQNNGLDFWLAHLGRKNWFTDEVRTKFISVWNSAKA